MHERKRDPKLWVHFTTSLADGTVIACSRGGGPVPMQRDCNALLPGITDGLAGLQPGQRRVYQVPPEHAYGCYDRRKVKIVERAQLPEGACIRLGQEWRAQRPDGAVLRFRVVKLDDRFVTFDGNHPLAGETLVHEVDLIGQS